MTTSTSLNLRALLKTAVARSGMDAPARARVRADAVGEGAARRRRRARAAARRRAVRRAERRRPRAGASPTSRFFLAALEGLSDAAAERAVLPFPSHEVDPYRGLAPHFGVDVGARARPARRSRRARARVVVASAAALLPRVSAPDAAAGGVDRPQARAGHRARPTSPTCSSTPASAARIRPTSTASSPSAAASSTSSRPARRSRSASSSSATRSRSLRTLRPGDAAIDRADRSGGDRAAAGRAAATARATQPRTPSADDDRRATLFDYLARAHDVARHRLRARRSGRQRPRSSSSSLQRSYEDARQPRGRPAAAALPPSDARRVGARAAHASTHARLGRRRLDASLELPRPQSPVRSATSRCQPAVEFRGRVADWVAEIRRLRDDGETVAVRRGDAGPRRAHDRAAARSTTSSPSRSSAPTTRATPPCSSRSAACRAASACPTRRCRSTPRPTSSRRSAARPSAAARRPRRSSRTCATSRSAISSSTSTTASACSSA